MTNSLSGKAEMADIDNDGALDIVVGDNSGKNNILWGK